MKPKKRQKMCCHCEGEVDLDVIVCPFCAADLREEKPEQNKASFTTTATLKNLNTQQSLYPPHYAPKASVEAPEEVAAVTEEGAVLAESEESKNIFGPIILIALGSQLLLFGILMLLFSNKGMMILKWDARLWFIYVFASIPFLIFGYRSVSKL